MFELYQKKPFALASVQHESLERDLIRELAFLPLYYRCTLYYVFVYLFINLFEILIYLFIYLFMHCD